MNIYVGNLSYNASDAELRTLFESYGTVNSVKIVRDRDTGRSRGFAFVEMQDGDGASAIAALNGKDLSGRNLVVNEARPREEGGGGGGGGGNRPRGNFRNDGRPPRRNFNN